MEALTKASWIFLALIHVMPALVLFAPSLTERLYQTAPTGEIGLLIVHRGALFLAVVAACIFAILDPSVRRPLSCIVAISVIGFLFVYLRGGMPEGALRTIALVDLVALAPLAFVTFQAWND
ncbi:MAG: hypothetical protein AAFQ59_09770 [Pseudomonadota bacterium]